MGSIVKSLQKALDSNNVEKVAQTMDEFERQVGCAGAVLHCVALGGSHEPYWECLLGWLFPFCSGVAPWIGDWLACPKARLLALAFW